MPTARRAVYLAERFQDKGLCNANAASSTTFVAADPDTVGQRETLNLGLGQPETKDRCLDFLECLHERGPKNAKQKISDAQDVVSAAIAKTFDAGRRFSQVDFMQIASIQRSTACDKTQSETEAAVIRAAEACKQPAAVFKLH